VARGFKQTRSSNLSYEVYSPVARMLLIRVLFSLCIEEYLYVSQLDVKCAFLNGDLPEPAYMEIPEGLECKNMASKCKHVCKLLKSLYGLRVAPKCWYEKDHVTI